MRALFLAASIAACLTLTAHAQESVSARADKIISKLEVLNNIGLDCEAELQVRGLAGADSEKCTKFFTNLQGDYLTSIGTECTSLSEWYNSKRRFIQQNPNYSETNPTEAAALVTDMKKVLATCNPESWEKYVYLQKPLSTLSALKELQ